MKTFIDPKEITSTPYIRENADEKLIVNAICISQDLYILPMIGSGIDGELKSQLETSALSPVNTTLLQSYIVPALRYWTLYELAEPMTYKFTSKSILKNSGTSEPITFRELTDLKHKFLRIAQWYTERLKFFLQENHEQYPLYRNLGNGVDVIHPNETYDVGLYMGDDNLPDFIKEENY